MSELPRLLTAREVAQQLGVSRAVVYAAVREHGLPVVHLGRALRFSTTSVAEWIRHGGSRNGGDGDGDDAA